MSHPLGGVWRFTLDNWLLSVPGSSRARGVARNPSRCTTHSDPPASVIHPAEYTVVHEVSVAKIDKSAPLESVCLLGCGELGQPLPGAWCLLTAQSMPMDCSVRAARPVTGPPCCPAWRRSNFVCAYLLQAFSWLRSTQHLLPPTPQAWPRAGARCTTRRRCSPAPAWRSSAWEPWAWR